MKTKLLLALLLVGVAGAQDKTDKPKLKDSVRADIRELQYEEAQLQLQYRNVDDNLKAKLGTALKDSSIDEKKWRLDTNSLEVVAIEQK